MLNAISPNVTHTNNFFGGEGLAPLYANLDQVMFFDRLLGPEEVNTAMNYENGVLQTTTASKNIFIS